MIEKFLANKPMRIGIIGGGQLGKMMAQEAKKMGMHITILDPSDDCPAASIATKHIIGDFYDEKRIEEIVASSDVTTYDIEHINAEVLKKLEKEGHQIYPSPNILELIQDKLRQKDVLSKNNIPVSRYQKVEGPLIESVKEFGFPVVQKACKGGYDGRGIFVIKNEKDVENAIKAESFLEEFIDFEKELAVNVARDINGKVKCYPVVEMIFDPRANICDMVIAPARIEENIEREAKDIGVKVVEALNGIGIFGIELFLTKDGKILVNEVAPRPHNSGHYTIEACATSQFEQHIRAITGLPLGSTEILTPAVMINILGAENYSGPAIYTGINELLSIPGLNLHIYGKSITKPFRKMGHITIVDKDVEKAIEKAEKAKDIIKVVSNSNER